MLFIVTIICLIPVFLIGGVEDHLKKITHKTEGHSLRNIDFIYTINLDRRPEKWQWTQEQLAPYGIYPFRVSAVNGWELTGEILADVGLKFSPEMAMNIMGTFYSMEEGSTPQHELIQEYGKTYFVHTLSRGAIGCALSHISVLQDAADSHYETIWVTEDDIEIIRDPRLLSDYIDKLDQLVGKENWDILFTDRDIKNSKGESTPCWWAAPRPDYIHFTNEIYLGRTQISPDFIKIGARWGSHSMIIRKSGIEKLLQFYKAHQIFLPYDLDYILPRGINLYTVTEDIISNFPGAPTDNGVPNYLYSNPN